MVNESSKGEALRGKVVMVTGANSGMGKEISLGLARLGATLVMVSLDRQRGESARSEAPSSCWLPTCLLSSRFGGWSRISKPDTTGWTSWSTTRA